MYVEGRIKTRKWQDKDGQDRYSTEVVADRMQMLGSRGGMGAPTGDGDEERSRSAAPAKASSGKAGAKFDDFEDDIPF